jgi:hypothetical protein
VRGVQRRSFGATGVLEEAGTETRKGKMEMAKRKRAASRESRDGKLEEPFPSSPTRKPRYSLKVVNAETGKTWYLNTYALYAMVKIFDALTDGLDIEVDKDCAICGDYELTSPELKEIMGYVMTKEEEAWELPQPYKGNVERFLGKVAPVVEKPAAEKPERVVRTKTVKSRDKEGLVTIQQVCEELGIEPRIARGIMRKLKVEKPEGGWAWPADQVEAIKEKLKS